MSASVPVDLVEKLACLDDLRSSRGRRHSLASVLLTTLAAVLMESLD